MTRVVCNCTEVLWSDTSELAAIHTIPCPFSSSQFHIFGQSIFHNWWNNRVTKINILSQTNEQIDRKTSRPSSLHPKALNVEYGMYPAEYNTKSPIFMSPQYDACRAWQCNSQQQHIHEWQYISSTQDKPSKRLTNPRITGSKQYKLSSFSRWYPRLECLYHTLSTDCLRLILTIAMNSQWNTKIVMMTSPSRSISRQIQSRWDLHGRTSRLRSLGCPTLKNAQDRLTGILKSIDAKQRWEMKRQEAYRMEVAEARLAKQAEEIRRLRSREVNDIELKTEDQQTTTPSAWQWNLQQQHAINRQHTSTKPQQPHSSTIPYLVLLILHTRSWLFLNHIYPKSLHSPSNTSLISQKSEVKSLRAVIEWLAALIVFLYLSSYQVLYSGSSSCPSFFHRAWPFDFICTTKTPATLLLSQS